MPININDKVQLAQYAQAVASLQGIPLPPERLDAVVGYLQLAGRLAAQIDSVALPNELELAGLYQLPHGEQL